jgi:hypothetical protein
MPDELASIGGQPAYGNLRGAVARNKAADAFRKRSRPPLPSARRRR